ncbi:hypothetical protein [Halomonas sp. WWR20]
MENLLSSPLETLSAMTGDDSHNADENNAENAEEASGDTGNAADQPQEGAGEGATERGSGIYDRARARH